MRPRLLLAAAALVAPVLAAPVLAAPLAQAAPAARADGGPGIGFDVSFPQCQSRTSPNSGPLPTGAAFGIVGVNNGSPLTTNPCFVPQYAWASGSTPAAPQVYVNTANPVAAGGHWGVDPTPQPCSSASPAANADDTGCAYDYGYYAANDAVKTLDAAGEPVRAITFWLDVESGNMWRSDATGKTVNAAVLAGYVAGLRSRPDRVAGVGIYTNTFLWKSITGQVAAQPPAPGTDGIPLWYPVGTDGQGAALAHCSDTTTPNGGRVALVQWVANDSEVGKSLDHDQACAAAAPAPPPPAVPPTVKAATDSQQAGRAVTVTGTATPGTTLTLAVTETLATVPRPVGSVTASAAGAWTASFPLMSDAMLTVTDASGLTASRALTADVGVAVSRVSGAGVTSAGVCKTRLDGSTFPWVAGQQAFVRGGLDKQVGYANVRRKGTLGVWSATVTSACGKATTVKVTVAGVVRPTGQRFANDGRTPAVALHPRKPGTKAAPKPAATPTPRPTPTPTPTR